jgi:hypothetical protein
MYLGNPMIVDVGVAREVRLSASISHVSVRERSSDTMTLFGFRSTYARPRWCKDAIVCAMWAEMANRLLSPPVLMYQAAFVSLAEYSKGR